MNKSKVIFPGDYEMVQEQSNGECDYIDGKTNEKFDAKVPFEPKHMKMLAQGKKYNPDVRGWIETLKEEADEYTGFLVRNNSISELKLYNIIKERVEKEREDENIVFFLPYPISVSVEGAVYAQFFANYFDDIFSQLKRDLNLGNRKIYVVYPSSEKNKFALKQIDVCQTEYIICEELGRYFTTETNI